MTASEKNCWSIKYLRGRLVLLSGEEILGIRYGYPYTYQDFLG